MLLWSLCILSLTCLSQIRHTDGQRQIYLPLESNTYEDKEQSSECALVLHRTYVDRSPAPAYGGFFEAIKHEPVTTGTPEEICIRYSDVNNAVLQARRGTNYRHPRAVDDTLEPGSLDLSATAALTLEVTKILAEQFQLSADEILNGLPLIDTSRTSLWDVCPAYVKPLPCTLERYRTFTGHCNNLQHPSWGATHTAFVRFLPPAYADGIEAPRVSVVDGTDLPSARLVSTTIHRDADAPSESLSILLMSWGQFIDHDLTLGGVATDENGEDFECCGVPKEQQNSNCLPIDIPRNDYFYSRFGQTCMEFKRLLPGHRPNCALGPRVHINMLSSPLDANFIYGSTEELARNLRLGQGGLLRYWDRFRDVGLKPLLPPQSENPDRDCIGRPRKLFCFMAGDERVNEQIHLTVLHTLYLRDHNRVATELSKINPHWDDERLYQETRHLLAAQVQHITYNEFLPMMLGDDLITRYNLSLAKDGYWNGYDPNVHMGLSNSFQAAAFRFGHTHIHGLVMMFNKYHEFVGEMKLRDLLRSPFIIYNPGVLDELIAGLLNYPSQGYDPHITTEVSNHLFQEPNVPFGADLPAINIQRGRESGVPGYNDFREWCGLPRAHSFEDLVPYLSNGTAYRYSKIFKHVDDIDLWSAGISEYRLPGTMFGPTFACVLARQFINIRRGDRFWYENSGFPSAFTPEQLREIRKTTQAKIICENADDIPTTQMWVMQLPHPIYNPRVRCEDLPQVDLRYWKEDPVHGGFPYK